VIGVIVPSRGRPRNVVELVEAWAETRSGEADLLICIDDDDPLNGQYLTADQLPKWAKIISGPRRRLGGTLNFAAPAIAERYEMVGFMGDDHRPRTPGWDRMISEVGASTYLAVAYGDDLFQHAALPTAVFMDSRIVRRLGWMVLPGQTHLFMDNLWKTLGEQLGALRYLPDVVIEHVHPAAGKGEWDAGYAEVNAGPVWEADEALYKEWVAYRMPGDIATLIGSRT